MSHANGHKHVIPGELVLAVALGDGGHDLLLLGLEVAEVLQGVCDEPGLGAFLAQLVHNHDHLADVLGGGPAGRDRLLDDDDLGEEGEGKLDPVCVEKIWSMFVSMSAIYSVVHLTLDFGLCLYCWDKPGMKL